MSVQGLPPKQGLYDPRFEHDACGIGFVAHIKGQKSNRIVKQALTALRNMDHRGAQGSEVNTGDGAGILLQIPHIFFRQNCLNLQIELPEPEYYGVGMVFLPQDEPLRRKFEQVVEKVIAEEGQTLLGWRTVPVNNQSLGDVAKSGEPFVRQVFVGRSSDLSDADAFERKLYVIRKRAEHAIRRPETAGRQLFYVASLSCRTIVYKGMLTTSQLEEYYPELLDESVETALALVHSRFSTNTFPSWERAHPNRFLIHNGEINTLRGNVNWMHARQALLESDFFGDDINKLLPIIDEDGSDSAMFDNTLEFLVLAGRSLPHAAMMMIPEPWSNHETMSPEKRAFYEYHSCLMEPWDGPAAMVFTDGKQIAAVLDRNGLRPARYYVTKDDLIVLASEVGVLDIPAKDVVQKERLHPGRMLLVDLQEQRIVSDDEVKEKIAREFPYRAWLDEHLVPLDELPDPVHVHGPDHKTLQRRQTAFGYTYEVLDKMVKPMAQDAVDPIGSMGVDAPLAVLSKKPQPLYNYFKQLFAQVTNPPIDAIREEIITATTTTLGPERNLLDPQPESCRQIEVKTPILTNEEFAKLIHLDSDGWKSQVLSTLFDVHRGGQGLKQALDDLFAAADEAVDAGANVLVLSDRGIDEERAAIPALLAVAGVHHHLIRNGKRMKVGLVIESGEPREVHHFALLIGYGASAINPYLALESIDDMILQGVLTDLDFDDAVHNYVKAATKGVVKVLSKMGISTIQSYHGAQIFEAVGLSQEVVDRYFTWTPSRIEGIGLDEIAQEVKMRHQHAFAQNGDVALDSGGHMRWRRDGEAHLYNPQTVHMLQYACRTDDYNVFKQYSAQVNDHSAEHFTLRGLLNLKPSGNSVPIDEVEPVESIMKRFKTGAMSYGSISKEAHESLAIAMNRIGGKSNTGEGGEDPARFVPDENGDLRRSAIKQVASGRFGVTSNYLVNATEIQIKMAQGAKPGEGGQLPGRKVYPWIAEVRHSTPGVGLISPPPHHDIYSIEDLAELIHDLKNANPQARISVKLVAEVGVGTIAAGVAKGKADVVLISGHDGGTGASPLTSIYYSGLPWELGLAETHQTLVLNNLRDRIAVETDGKLMTGRDVVIAALLGAEEFGFATAPLVVLGCVMMRVCHLDTCPVGVATQNPELRKNFAGDPAHVVNFMRFIAQEVRELMAELGCRRIEELVGRTDLLEPSRAVDHFKAQGVDLSAVLYQPEVGAEVGRYCQVPQDHKLDDSLDRQVLIPKAMPALEGRERVDEAISIRNTNRVAGTLLGSEVTRRYGAEGLPEDTIVFRFSGTAGQSFGAFVPKGMTMLLEGDANDYVGKGLSGGKIAVYPPENASYVAEDNVVIGNVALYGATSGEAYIRGVAGERFCVRNSGVRAVVEGVGDHGCEYMTGGRVVVLGRTGRNFGAGMSGGIAYVYDEAGDFDVRCNTGIVWLESLTDPEEIDEIKQMIVNHIRYTNSEHAKRILKDWDVEVHKFVKVIPKDFKRMQEAIQEAERMGHTGAEAIMAAFEQNKNDVARVSGN
ncbi:glutamate synthase large subunit [Alicyclobacillus tolerans]|uniref:glutamate synthase large subunit n=1 Tax=Alicyclobacillus tolerans TaxID=90970 RepID=UPI001F01DAEC|nr:glutamate synthase large subunit [Alicyclobacillus tolerans]MCF8565305.1 glutamate synthase large subunit [Alicyclobacillus tolerans]